MGRPRKNIDVKLVEELAGLNCSLEEIARVVGCAVSTLQRGFDQVIKKGRESVNTSLKRKQYEVAMSGNVTMLIWLGKNYLGQRDKVETREKSELTIVRKIVDLRNPSLTKKDIKNKNRKKKK